MTSSPPQATEPLEPVQPIPSRFRRLKIWSAITVVALLFLTGVRVWWGHVADARFDAYISAAHARGEKIVRDDYVIELGDPAKNAANLIRPASTRISFTPAQETWENNFTPELPLAPSDAAVIAQIIEANRSSLDDLRQARSRPDSDWAIRLANPVYMTLLPHLNPARSLSNLAEYSALYEHTAGNDAEAIELAADLLRLQKIIGMSAPATVCHAVGLGIHTRACELLFQLAAALDVRDMNTPPSTTRPASRNQVLGLIATLLDDRDIVESARAAWHGERMMALDMAPQFGGMFAPRPIAWLLEPMVKLDALRVARGHDDHAAAMAQTSFPIARAMAKPYPSTTRPSRLQKVTTTFSANVTFSWSRGVAGNFGAILERRAAATLLALRLYALDHDGALPPTLDALVPTYLPSPPIDPFADDARPLGYRPAATQPFIYSVGPDGIDSGGERVAATSKPAAGPLWQNKWAAGDVAYYIGPAIKAQSSTTQSPGTQTPPESR